ncbi:MAG TPA: hypothetical protein VIM46_00960 [Luteolibacter sp.]
MIDWQTIVALSVVTLTLVVFYIRLSRMKKGTRCGHNCGCDHSRTIEKLHHKEH